MTIRVFGSGRNRALDPRLGGAFASVAAWALVACSSNSPPQTRPRTTPEAGAPMTFQEISDAALRDLLEVFYENGNWKLCAPTSCGILPYDDFDWGADSLTAALYLRYTFDKDSSLVPIMNLLQANGATYETCTYSNCPTWSDVPLWDSIAFSHEHLVTQSNQALERAKGAFAYVDTATEFALGACPEIDFQIPLSGGDPLTGSNVGIKTLETDSNYIKAALLLHRLTGTSSYLDKATSKYAAVRKYFLDPSIPLYTVYVIDDGKTCSQIPRRFYGSVNGNMIWNGITLAASTGMSSYLTDAIATAKAVSQDLSDAAGIYADLQTDDDVVEPLIEGMYELSKQPGQSFATDWLLRNARAMTGAKTASGVYGRFFDGPPPPAQVTEWQANGGFALAFVAGALAPTEDGASDPGAWQSAIHVQQDISTLPSSIDFTGRAIALFGTLGETSHQLGQAKVFIDGVETFDQTGVHQDESNAFASIPDSILFAWRWPTSGPHTLSFAAQTPDPKDGGSFLHVQSYSYLP
jgi:hypothetical protein